MPMSPRLLRPRQTIHPEAADWANRVRNAGGSVSGTTLGAVDRFVKAIHAAGIRDRFFRLNLFAGNSDASLNAVRTPLFRGQSLAGTQYGNAIDTNVNFVQGDYAESVGLNANGTPGNSSKYIDTGLSPDAMPTLATGHASVFKGAGSVGGYTIGLIGSRTALQFYYIRQVAITDVLSANWGHGVLNAGTTARTGAGLAMFTRTAANAMSGYHNTTSDLSDTGTRAPTANANAFVVFGFRNTDGTLSSFVAWPYVISAYSIGAGMTAAQVASYHTALTAFLAALGRATT